MNIIRERKLSSIEDYGYYEQTLTVYNEDGKIFVSVSGGYDNEFFLSIEVAEDIETPLEEIYKDYCDLGMDTKTSKEFIEKYWRVIK